MKTFEAFQLSYYYPFEILRTAFAKPKLQNMKVFYPLESFDEELLLLVIEIWQ